MNRILLVSLAGACLAPLLAQPAHAFGAQRSGCNVMLRSGGASLEIQIYSESTGFYETETDRQTRQWEQKIIVAYFQFPNTAPLTEGTERLNGRFVLGVEEQDPTSSFDVPWRDGWSLGGTTFSVEMLESEADDISVLQLAGTGPAGPLVLESGFRNEYATFGRRLDFAINRLAREEEVFALLEHSSVVELRALREDASMLGAASFDLSSASRLIDEFFTRMPALLEEYEFGTLIGEFDCNQDITL